MKRVAFILRLSFLLISISGCNTSAPAFKEMQVNDGTISLKIQGTDTLMICKVDKNQETIDFPLSELIEDFQIIHFENSEQAFFKAWYITVTDNHIGVRQSDATFKLFNKEGKFLCDVGAKGNGPGEYAVSVYDEIIDEQNQCILFTLFYGKKIMMYGLDGKWIKDINLPGQINKPKIKRNQDGSYSVLNMSFSEDEPFVFQVDQEGKMLKMFPTAPYMTVESYNGEIFSYQNSDKFDFYHTSIDTLFHYDATNNRLLPRFTATFPDLNKTPIHIYTELPHHFILNYYSWEEGQFSPGGTVLIDKKKKASAHFQLVNDFFGNLPVEHPGNHFNKGWFIDNLEPGNLREKIEAHLASGKCPDQDKNRLKEFASSLHENDNNLLFIGRLKR